MEQKQKYIIGAIIGLVILVIGIGLYVILGATDLSDEDVIDTAQDENQSTDQPASGGTSGNSSSGGGSVASSTPLTQNILEVGAVSATATDNALIRYAKQSTGEIFDIELFVESDVSEPILDLPGGAISYAFLTDENSFKRYVLYKRGDRYYAYNQDRGEEVALSLDIDFAVIEDVGDDVYYIANQSGVESEIRVMDWDGKSERVLVDRPGIQWMQLSRGMIFYRTATQIYRYNLLDQTETLIQSGSVGVSATFSPNTLTGIIDVDGVPYFYELQNTSDDVLSELPFEIDPKDVIWRADERSFYNIRDNTLFKYDWLNERSYSWEFLEDIDENSFDYSSSFVMGDGTIVLTGRDGTLNVLPGFSREGI